MFGPEYIRINLLMNELIKTMRSAVSQNCTERDFFVCGVSREFFETLHS